jgi:hypothetical protein
VSWAPETINFNRLGAQRPVSPYSTEEAQRIRKMVAGWQGKSLHVQEAQHLRKLAAALTGCGELLSQYSAHGPRLLASVNQELARRDS